MLAVAAIIAALAYNVRDAGDAQLFGGVNNGGYTPVTSYEARTTSYVSASASTIPVSTLSDKAGNSIDISLISPSESPKVYFSIGPGTSREEIVYCTGKSSTAWTGCVRGLSFQGGDETPSSTLAVAHNAGEKVIMTDVGQFFNQYVSTVGNQAVQGIKTFFSFPQASSSFAVPTSTAQFVTKYYVDSVGAGGFTSSNVSSTLGLQAITSGIPACPSAAACVGINASSTTALTFDPAGRLQISASTTGGIYFDTLGRISVDSSDTFRWSATHTFDVQPIDANGARIGLPVGVLMPYSTTTAPTGWLVANGSAVSRTTYAALFATIGTTYGAGDGSLTFNLPDLRGRTVHGTSSTEPAYDTIGETGGSSTHIMTIDELVPHTHGAPVDNSGTGGTVRSAVNSNGAGASQKSTDSTGNGRAFDIKDPYITMVWIIKY